MRLETKIIREAQQGRPYAICFLKEYYDSYITTLSRVTITDVDGKRRTFIHYGIKEELQAFLMQVTLKFDYKKGLTKNDPTA